MHCAVADPVPGGGDGVGRGGAPPLPPGAQPAGVLASKTAPEQLNGASSVQREAASPHLPGSPSDPTQQQSGAEPAPSPDVLGVRL